MTATTTLELTPILDDPELAGVLRGDLMAWTEAAQDELLAAARAHFETIIQPEELDAITLTDINPRKLPKGRQIELIKAGRWCLAHKEPFNIIAEQGSGKTKMTINITQLEILKAKRDGKHFRVLVICPAYLIEKWIREYTEEFDAAARWAVRQGWFSKPPKLNTLIAARIEDLSPHQPKHPFKVHPTEADVFFATYEDISLSHKRTPVTSTRFVYEENGRISYQLCACEVPKDMSLSDLPPCCPGHRQKEGSCYFCGRHHGPPFRALSCPRCGVLQYEENADGVKSYVTPATYGKSWRKCIACDEPLWQASAKGLPAPKGIPLAGKLLPGPQGERQSGPQDVLAWAKWQTSVGSRKLAIAEYVKRHIYHHFTFDVTVVDEVHLAKSAESARGQAAGTLLQKAKTSRISLTATATGGYASSVFPLGQRTWPTLREDFGYREVSRFVDLHGTWERTYERGEGPKPDEEDVGAISSRKRDGAYGKSKKKEVPGLSPAAYIYFLSHAGFAQLKEIFPSLPPYQEDVWAIDLDDVRKAPITVMSSPYGGGSIETKTELWSQREAYAFVEKYLRDLMLEALNAGSKRYLSIYFQNALRYQNVPTERLTIEDPETKRLLLDVSPFPEHFIFPKEDKVINAVVDAARDGLKSLVYVHHVHAPDVATRLYQQLSRWGTERLGRPLKVAVLRAGQVKRQHREAYIEEVMLRQNHDVLICSPQLVEMGLDLVWARQIIWYQQITSVYTMSQASRRSMRPGVEGKVNVNFALYQGTTEMLVAQLMAKKLRVHALMSGSGQYAAFTRDLSGAMDLTTMLAEQLSTRSRSLFEVDPSEILASLKPVIVLHERPAEALELF